MTAVASAVTNEGLAEQSEPFLHWLSTWLQNLEIVPFDEVFPDPARGIIAVVDLLVGFCREGSLASRRVDEAVSPSVALLKSAHQRGMKRFLIARDSHSPNAGEFEAWPSHCVRGTAEAELVPEIAQLPFASDFIVIEKNALSPGLNQRLTDWLESNNDLEDFLVVGDCTDLCVYQVAMYLRMWANAKDLSGKKVWVDASAVRTYDLPVGESGVMPHPGDLLHAVFLYHMALNGIRVVKSVRC